MPDEKSTRKITLGNGQAAEEITFDKNGVAWLNVGGKPFDGEGVTADGHKVTYTNGMLTSEKDAKTGQMLKGFVYYENVAGSRIVSEYDANTNTWIRDSKKLKGASLQEHEGEAYLFGAKMNGIVEYDDGQKLSYKNGKLNRKDGPAIDYPDGTGYWFRDGKLHRDDGGPAVTAPNGDKEWYREGKLDRKDGPAVEHANGDKEWYRNGEWQQTQHANGKIERASDGQTGAVPQAARAPSPSR